MVVSEAVEFQPKVTTKDVLKLVEDLLKEEEGHWRGGPVPPPREAEYLR